MNLKSLIIAFCAILTLGITSCSDDENELLTNIVVIQDTFEGNMNITSNGTNPAGDFTGVNKSGIYSFNWNNPQTKASANFDVTTDGNGTVQLIIKDANGTEVLNETRPQSGNDTYAGVSTAGTSGTWTVTFIFTNLNGDGSFSIHPGD